MAVTIGICTSSIEVNIEKLLSTLMSVLPMIHFRMVPLLYNDLDSYPVERQGLDGLILCHSIHNMGFAITDVMDASYDTFLPRARRFFGKENVVVMAHDFAWPFRQGWSRYTMDNFRRNQPTAVDCSSLVIFCGKLDTTIEMDGDDWNKLLTNAKAVQPLKIDTFLEWCWQIFDAVSFWRESAKSLVVCIIMVIFGAIMFDKWKV